MCYSWWILSALSVIRRLAWIDAEQLRLFILKAQVRRAAPRPAPVEPP